MMTTYTLERILPSGDLYVATYDQAPYAPAESLIAVVGPVRQTGILDGGELINPEWWRLADQPGDPDDLAWYVTHETVILAEHSAE